MDYYAGIGNREVPFEDVFPFCTELAIRLNSMGYSLSSGGAIGCDQAFEKGASTAKRIYKADSATMESMLMAAKYHPKWSACNEYARKLHGRNLIILLGNSLGKIQSDAVKFVVCFAMSEDLGGTALALRVARDYGIPCLNLAKHPNITIDGAIEKILTF
jgi:hypothetical protein